MSIVSLGMVRGSVSGSVSGGSFLFSNELACISFSGGIWAVPKVEPVVSRIKNQVYELN